MTTDGAHDVPSSVLDDGPTPAQPGPTRPPAAAHPRPAWATAGAGVGAGTLIGLLFAGHWYVRSPATGWAGALRETMPRWWVWGLVAPLVARVDRRVDCWLAGRLGAGRRPTARLLRHLPLALGWTTVALAAQAALRPVIGAPPPPSWLRFVAVRYPWDVLVYGAIAGAAAALAAAAEARRRERDAAALAVRAARLEAGLAEARLHVLGAQLHPHFLFNALNTVSAYTAREPARARDLMAQLGELLRASLDHAARPEVTLAEELRFLDAYLATERARFADRLTVTVRADAAALGARVPAFVLQPLVENAIKHGITPRDAPGLVAVEARVEASVEHPGEAHGGTSDGDVRLVLRVRDDGVGLPGGWRLPAHGGVGLRNAAARLESLYPGRHRFSVRAAPDGGVLAEVEVPFRPDPSPTDHAGAAT
ncbi:hypothetical protein tb265_45340 [Gemmatimonadetes bacterium T265]|nr:hypothetical protein tb265_45340 [Gemmatimonadetes bacterium T265]